MCNRAAITRKQSEGCLSELECQEEFLPDPKAEAYIESLWSSNLVRHRYLTLSIIRCFIHPARPSF